MKAKRIKLELVKSEDVPLYNLFHRRAALLAAQGVGYLVLAGLQLQAEKKKLGHGNWEKWVDEHCDYDIRTAQKYAKLCEGVKARALKNESDSFFKLLEKAPADLKPAEQETLIAAVQKMTDGETVQALYLEFGIVKKPSGAGLRGKKRKHTPAAGVSDAAEEASDLWSPHLSFLESDGVELRSWKDLPADELKRLRSVLSDLNRLVKPKGK